jgi:hypothetical protein
MIVHSFKVGEYNFPQPSLLIMTTKFSSVSPRLGVKRVYKSSSNLLFADDAVMRHSESFISPRHLQLDAKQASLYALRYTVPSW